MRVYDSWALQHWPPRHSLIMSSPCFGAFMLAVSSAWNILSLSRACCSVPHSPGLYSSEQPLPATAIKTNMHAPGIPQQPRPALLSSTELWPPDCTDALWSVTPSQNELCGGRGDVCFVHCVPKACNSTWHLGDTQQRWVRSACGPSSFSAILI